MEFVLIFTIVSFLVAVWFWTKHSAEAQQWKEKYLHQCCDRDVLNNKIGELQSQLKSVQGALEVKCTQHNELSSRFDNLQHQKISADVKLGAKTENLLPFLSAFPYKDDEIRGLFNPVDLIVFRDSEVVFIEVKSGQSQLSEKQRQIRDNVKAGRVRFEVHRVDEKGVKVK
jgi:predicted Holliday junction resolvase-like endonuclease